MGVPLLGSGTICKSAAAGDGLKLSSQELDTSFFLCRGGVGKGDPGRRVFPAPYSPHGSLELRAILNGSK